MKNNLKNASQKGFTIIEVMIVLSIAGLILAIVLFAVPALQRNGRNSQVRTTANTLLGYLNEYPSNNNGATPKGLAISSSGDVSLGSVGTFSTCTTGCSTVGKISGGYTLVNGPVTATTLTSANVGNIYVGLDKKCTASGSTITFTSSTRSLSLGYVVETNSGVTAQCAG